MNVNMKRNYGVDLFRIFSMLMVLTLHITCHGGVMGEASRLANHSYLLTSFMAYFAFCCVDCFALISGYVGYCEDVPYKYHKYASFWLQAVFYGVFGRTIVLLFQPGQEKITYWTAFLPVISDTWWYFSAYTALFFLIPYINILIRGLSSSQFNLLIVTVTLLFSFVETISSKAPFRTDEGFSFLWIAVMYLIGAWIKKERIGEKLHGKEKLLLIIAITEMALTWIVAEKFGLSRLRNYTSPSILFFAVSLLIFFSTLNIRHNSTLALIRVFAPCAFGVYLMHVEEHFWLSIMKDAFRFVGRLPTLAIPFLVIGFAIAMYLAISVIELLRIKLFSLLRIDVIAKKAESSMRYLLCKHNTTTK